MNKTNNVNIDNANNNNVPAASNWYPNKEKLNLKKKTLERSYQNITYGHYNQLLVRGIGYRVWKQQKEGDQGSLVALDLGFTHFITVDLPRGISIVPKKVKMILFSKDKTLLNDFCLNLKKLKFPDSYKGKGIRFDSDNIVLKTGKVKN